MSRRCLGLRDRDISRRDRERDRDISVRDRDETRDTQTLSRDMSRDRDTSRDTQHLKSNLAFLQEVDGTVTFYIGPPPQPVTPYGGHPGNCHEQSSFFI